MEPEDERQRLARIRDLVVSAGSATDLVRFAVRALVVGGFITLVFQPWGAGATATRLIEGPLSMLGVVGFSLTLGAWLSPVAGLPLGAAYRRWRRLRIGRELAGLPPEQVAAVLLPLRDHAASDTGKIVAGLLRDFAPSTEIVPAAAPEGKGDEVSGEW